MRDEDPISAIIPKIIRKQVSKIPSILMKADKAKTRAEIIDDNA